MNNLNLNPSNKTWMTVRNRYASSADEHDHVHMKSIVDAMINGGQIDGVYADSSCYALLIYQHAFGTLGDFLQVVYEDNTYKVVGFYYKEDLHDYDMDVLSQNASTREVLSHLSTFKSRF